MVLLNFTPEEHKAMMKELIQEEIEELFVRLQLVFGDDDLISSGRAASLLGMCSKVFRILVQEGHFTVYYHLKERRFSRGEILNYRNKTKAVKRRRFVN